MCQALCWPWVIAGNKGPAAGRGQKEGRVAWVSAMDTAGPCLHGPRLPGYSGSYVSVHNGALSLRTPPRAAFPGLPLYRCDVAWVWPHQLLFLPPVRSLLREPVPPVCWEPVSAQTPQKVLEWASGCRAPQMGFSDSPAPQIPPGRAQALCPRALRPALLQTRRTAQSPLRWTPSSPSHLYASCTM